MNTMYVHYRREVWPVEVVRTTSTRYVVRRISDGVEMSFYAESREAVGHSYGKTSGGYLSDWPDRTKYSPPPSQRPN